MIKRYDINKNPAVQSNMIVRYELKMTLPQFVNLLANEMIDSALYHNHFMVLTAMYSLNITQMNDLVSAQLAKYGSLMSYKHSLANEIFREAVEIVIHAINYKQEGNDGHFDNVKRLERAN